MKKKDERPTIERIKVEQLKRESGKYIENQFIIWTPEGKYLQSNRSIIAFIPTNTFLYKPLIVESVWKKQDKKELYSLYIFFSEGKLETQRKINFDKLLLTKTI